MNWQFPVIEHSFGTDDTIRYALALGVGRNFTDKRELRLVNDYSEADPVALPMMAVIRGFPGSWMADGRTGIDLSKIVHGEEAISIHRALPSSGKVYAHHKVTNIVDKGKGRGAIITYAKELYDADDGAHLATVTHSTFARADGGFFKAQQATDAHPPPPSVPKRPTDRSTVFQTMPQQALMYRLCADRNPLHSTPIVAKEAGFDGPILHGLCTFGIAGYVMISEFCDMCAARLVGLSTRFVSPVYPGDALTFQMYREGTEIYFRVLAEERNVVVLDHGKARVL